MKRKHRDIIMENRIFGRIALGTVLILLIPLALTIRDGGVEGVGWNWSPSDFVIMGTLIFGMASMFVLAARKVPNKIHRMFVAVIFALAFLAIWAQMAVGAVTRLLDSLL
jgi:hypothetical protein